MITVTNWCPSINFYDIFRDLGDIHIAIRVESCNSKSNSNGKPPSMKADLSGFPTQAMAVIWPY